MISKPGSKLISSLEADDDGWTPVCVASNEGHLDCLRFLAEHKASLEQATNDGLTPRDIALQNDRDDIVAFLNNYNRK